MMQPMCQRGGRCNPGPSIVILRTSDHRNYPFAYKFSTTRGIAAVSACLNFELLALTRI
jgi:hypothetical protein